MEHPGVERLRAHLRCHNRRAAVLAFMIFAAAAALWMALYFVAWWLFLLGGTATKPLDYHPASGPLARGFAATAVLLCVCAWVGRRLRPNEAPQDHKSFGEHFLDVLLAVPRLTLAIFGTGGAVAWLSDSELDQAWNLLRRLNEAGSPVPVQELPVDIPDPAMRKKILLALQLSGVIDIHPTATGRVLTFRDDRARELAQERVRLRF